MKSVRHRLRRVEEKYISKNKKTISKKLNKIKKYLRKHPHLFGKIKNNQTRRNRKSK